ncbi:hypothetical protein TRFO_08202 [Tritrichomonas foetus]|uniref:Uncharacterized protein n=1 Tax=Tritrichomonas foetus TaxID=1144522 RepID=A0A1J4JQV2_9EUKA|nr:hypothetical protein TRFO_08202 [Tritrichomonas foetus]|eukprot:OHS99893.1 hypothetical protein TRFO_08202 [Tritrichomonas foetus]
MIVQTLLEAGLGFDHVNHNGWNFLHFAVSNGYENIVESVQHNLSEPILRRGDIYNRTVMHHAAINGQLHIIQILDSLGFDLYSDKDKFGKTPLHYAAELGHNRALKFLITKIGINETDRSGQTPLHLAVINNNFDVVNTLLHEEDIDINIMDTQQRTPLYLAVENARRKIAMQLVNSGADLTLIPSNGRSLVSLAVLTRSKSVVEYLCNLENIDIFAPDTNQWWTPVHYAAQLGEFKMMQFFYEIEPSSMTTKDRTDRTPLHIAAIWNQFKIVEFYNETDDFDFNGKDINGNTPLHLAVKRGNVQIARYLINSTNSDLNIQNNLGVFFICLSDTTSYCNRYLVN